MHGMASQWLPVSCQGTFGSAERVTMWRVKLLVACPNDNLRPNAAALCDPFPVIPSTASAPPPPHDRRARLAPRAPLERGACTGDAEPHRRRSPDPRRVGSALGRQLLGAVRQPVR